MLKPSPISPLRLSVPRTRPVYEKVSERRVGPRMLQPYPAERMRLYPVSPRANSVKNDDASLIQPLMAEGGVRV